ncbi:MAG: trehalase family glycosidase [Planctomycetota bacterium]
MLEDLKKAARSLGAARWRGMLGYTAELHARSVLAAQPPFRRPWEEIGPGYVNSPAFGHWDIVHEAMDCLAHEPEHAADQIRNLLAFQGEDGFLPGLIVLRGGKAHWNPEITHPPVWPFAVQELADLYRDDRLLRECLEPLKRQIRWFERKRAAVGGGFYYEDVVSRRWESGVDEGVRFDQPVEETPACVDATAHLYACYEIAAKWATALGEEASEFSRKADELGRFIREKLFDAETGFFHDSWAVGRPVRRALAFEGMWPMVVGAASPEQAQRVIDENLLRPDRFLTEHPISTVAVSDPRFELRMWRGPAWNSMTFWTARGCARYDRADAARVLLERALDASAASYERTGTIWEFYHPRGGQELDLARKPHTKYNTPCRNYLGHNPLIAMARLWEAVLA